MREFKNEFNKNTMRYRPKRENYAIGQFGEIDYQEMLERYCTYLENQNKQLRLHVVSQQSEPLKAFRLWYNNENDGGFGSITNIDIDKYLKSL